MSVCGGGTGVQCNQKMNAAVGDKYTYELVKLFEQEGRKTLWAVYIHHSASSRAGPGVVESVLWGLVQ